MKSCLPGQRQMVKMHVLESTQIMLRLATVKELTCTSHCGLSPEGLTCIQRVPITPCSPGTRFFPLVHYLMPRLAARCAGSRFNAR